MKKAGAMRRKFETFLELYCQNKTLDEMCAILQVQDYCIYVYRNRMKNFIKQGIIKGMPYPSRLRKSNKNTNNKVSFECVTVQTESGLRKEYHAVVMIKTEWGYREERNTPQPIAVYRDKKIGAEVKKFPPGFAFGIVPQRSIGAYS